MACYDPSLPAGPPDTLPLAYLFPGVDLGEHWRVRFNATGPLGGTVNDRSLAAAVHTEAQHSAAVR